MNSFTSIPRRVRIAAAGTTLALAAGLTLAIASPAHAAAPMGGADAFAVTQDVALTVGNPGLFANDSDPEGDSFGFHSVWPPAGGVLPGEELQTVPEGGLVYFPPTGYTGTRTWQYRLEDAADVSDYIDIVFTISPAAPPAPTNQPPVGTADTYNVAQNSWINIPAPGLLANDSDPDGDPLTLVGQGYDTVGPLGESMTTWADGRLAYLAAPGFVGTRTWWYEVSDGTHTVKTEIHFVVAPAPAGNVAPVATNDAYSIIPGSFDTSSPGALINDSDADGDPISIAKVEPQGGGALPGESLVIDLNGAIHYVSPTGFLGQRTWRYAISDGYAESDWAEITFTIEPLVLPNTLPIAVDDAYDVVKEQPLVVSAPGLLANDLDLDGDTLSLVSYIQPDVWLPGEAFAVTTVDGAFTYTPPTGFVGTRLLTYNIADGTDVSQLATITFTIEEPTPADPTPADPTPTDPTPASPPLPTLPTRPQDQTTLASTGAEGATIAGLAGLAGILVALGILARRLARREA